MWGKERKIGEIEKESEAVVTGMAEWGKHFGQRPGIGWIFIRERDEREKPSAIPKVIHPFGEPCILVLSLQPAID